MASSRYSIITGIQTQLKAASFKACDYWPASADEWVERFRDAPSKRLPACHIGVLGADVPAYTDNQIDERIKIRLTLLVQNGSDVIQTLSTWVDTAVETLSGSGVSPAGGYAEMVSPVGWRVVSQSGPVLRAEVDFEAVQSWTL